MVDKTFTKTLILGESLGLTERRGFMSEFSMDNISLFPVHLEGNPQVTVVSRGMCRAFSPALILEDVNSIAVERKLSLHSSV